MLNLENISKTYNISTPNENEIFKDFSLDVEPGEFISIIGSNGSGKSSILNIISGSVPADSGKVLLEGVDISKKSEYMRSKYISRVFQNPAVGTCPSMTILENMSMADNKGKPFTLGRCINHKRIDYFKELISHLKLGLENNMNAKVSSLSGGQRQAIALVMATMFTPKLLLLDEHTAALDPKTSHIIMELTNEIVTEKKITTIMVTHNLRHAANYGNRLIMLHEGEIAMDINGKEKEDIDMAGLMEFFGSKEYEG